MRQMGHAYHTNPLSQTTGTTPCRLHFQGAIYLMDQSDGSTSGKQMMWMWFGVSPMSSVSQVQGGLTFVPDPALGPRLSSRGGGV